MNKLHIFLIILLFQLYSRIIAYPSNFYSVDNFHVLFTNEDDFYYIYGGSEKMGFFCTQNKSNFNRVQCSYMFYCSSCIFIEDLLYNYFFFYKNKYYKHEKGKPNGESPYSWYFETIEINSMFENFINRTFVDSIVTNGNDIIIYGYLDNYIYFLTNFNFTKNLEIINEIEGLSCKIIEDKNFICAIISESNLEIYCLIKPSDFSSNELILYNNANNLIYDSISSFGLYDTDINNIKLLCRQIDQNIKCSFFKIFINEESSRYELIGDENIIFTTSNNFTEKNCYFTKIFNLYFFCCGITNLIKCYNININTYNIIKDFKISLLGDNSNLNVIINNDCASFFFLNIYIYHYYICIPTCKNKAYTILNSLNENKEEEEFEKLSNLFTIKAKEYYFEILNNIDDIGYFTLNNSRIGNRTLIDNNNYILDFIATNTDKSEIIKRNITYRVLVEELPPEGFSKVASYSITCELDLTIKACYYSCSKCSKDIFNSNDKQHNCINCRENYYKSPDNNNNCFLKEEKKINWYFDYENSEFGLCDEKCFYSCTGPKKSDCIELESDISLFEFKNRINNSITSYVIPSKIVNGTDFLATILSSDKLESEKLFKKGKSTFDLGNCANVIKEYYKIQKEKSLIIVIIELKNDEYQENSNGNKYIYFGKDILLEIYDYSGKKLNLSV